MTTVRATAWQEGNMPLDVTRNAMVCLGGGAAGGAVAAWRSSLTHAFSLWP